MITRTELGALLAVSADEAGGVAALARELGMNPATLAAVIKGRRRPSLPTLVALAPVTDPLTPAELLTMAKTPTAAVLSRDGRPGGRRRMAMLSAAARAALGRLGNERRRTGDLTRQLALPGVGCGA